MILDDLFGVKLWGENIFRRLLHHISGNNYNSNKKPLVFQLPLIDTETLKKVQELELPEKMGLNTTYFGKVDGQYSTKSTLYYNDFDADTSTKLAAIGNSLIPKLESLVNEELVLGKSDFKCMILRYEGKDSKFGMHYDAEHPDCYRVLILYLGGGVVPPFCYVDENKELQKIHLTEGEGIFFKGSQTYHGVFPSGNKDTVRYMVGFQYQKKGTREKKSFCTELRGATISKIVFELLPYFFYYQLVSRYSFHLFFRPIPCFNYPSPICSFAFMLFGFVFSQRFNAYPYSIATVAKFYFILLFFTSQYLLSFHLVSYFLFTELFHPSAKGEFLEPSS